MKFTKQKNASCEINWIFALCRAIEHSNERKLYTMVESAGKKTLYFKLDRNANRNVVNLMIVYSNYGNWKFCYWFFWRFKQHKNKPSRFLNDLISISYSAMILAFCCEKCQFDILLSCHTVAKNTLNLILCRLYNRLTLNKRE